MCVRSTDRVRDKKTRGRANHWTTRLAVAGSQGRLETPETDEASFYEELSNQATLVVVNEDETRTVDLKVQGASGG